jgi:hypothetical protein
VACRRLGDLGGLRRCGWVWLQRWGNGLFRRRLQTVSRLAARPDSGGSARGFEGRGEALGWARAAIFRASVPSLRSLFRRPCEYAGREVTLVPGTRLLRLQRYAKDSGRVRWERLGGHTGCPGLRAGSIQCVAFVHVVRSLYVGIASLDRATNIDSSSAKRSRQPTLADDGTPDGESGSFGTASVSAVTEAAFSRISPLYPPPAAGCGNDRN